MPASVLSRRETRGRKEGLSGIIVMPWEASSLIASSWGVLGVEQREDSSESVMEEIRGMEEMEHQWNNDLQHCIHGYDCLTSGVEF